MTGQGEGPWRAAGRWFASPRYRDKEVRAQMPLRPGWVFVKDAMPREGGETPGVVSAIEDRVEIAIRLGEFGVEEMASRRYPSEEELLALREKVLGRP